MRGKHARPSPAAEAARKAAPALAPALAVAGMVLTAQQHPLSKITTRPQPRTPNVPQAHHHGTTPGSEPTGPGLAHVALKMSLATAKAATHGTTYTVQPGDCLWTIAEKFYGNGADWTRIFDANPKIITTPGLARQHEPPPAPAPPAMRPRQQAPAPRPPRQQAPARRHGLHHSWVRWAPDSAQNQATMTQ